MSNPNHADLTVVLDRSGSMSSVADETISGLNHFLAEQRKLPGTAAFTLVQFDTAYEFVHRGIPIAAVPPLTRETFVPRGMTALLDAVGRAINETGERLAATPEQDRPGKVIFVILTDGQENSSREFTRQRIFEMIGHQREVYAWDFVFLGANQDAIGAGATLNIPAANAMNYAANAAGTKGAFYAASRGVGANRTAAMRGLGPVAYLTDEDRELQRKHGAKVS